MASAQRRALHTKAMGDSFGAYFLPMSLRANFTRSWVTLVLLPPSMDDELDEQKC